MNFIENSANKNQNFYFSLVRWLPYINILEFHGVAIATAQNLIWNWTLDVNFCHILNRTVSLSLANNITHDSFYSVVHIFVENLAIVLFCELTVSISV